MALKPWEIDRRRGGRTSSPTTSYYQSRYGTPTSRTNATKYYSQTSADRASTAARQKVAAQDAAKGQYYQGLSRELAGAQPAYQPDPVTDSTTALDQALAALNFSQDAGGGGRGSGGSGGSGGRGRGGAGAASTEAAPAELQAAMQAYIQSLSGIQNPYGEAMQRMAGMFDPSQINQRYDRLQGDVGAATGQARGRLGEIAGTLRERVGQAGQNIDRAYSNRIGELQGAEAQMVSAQNQDRAGLNDILSAFGAGSVQAEEAPLRNMYAASRGALGDARGMFQMGMADRATVGDQLRSDVDLGMSQDERALLSQIAARRAAETAALDQRRQQTDAEMLLRQMDWDAQQARELARARLEAAQLGIEL